MLVGRGATVVSHEGRPLRARAGGPDLVDLKRLDILFVSELGRLVERSDAPSGPFQFCTSARPSKMRMIDGQANRPFTPSEANQIRDAGRPVGRAGNRAFIERPVRDVYYLLHSRGSSTLTSAAICG